MPVCFPFLWFCSWASAFDFLTGFLQNLELRRFRGLMPYAEVTVCRKHDRTQHHAAVTQPLTGHSWLQWKRLLGGLFFVTSVVKNNFFKWPQEATRSECLELLCCVEAAIFLCFIVPCSKQGVCLWTDDLLTIWGFVIITEMAVNSWSDVVYLRWSVHWTGRK